MRNKILYALAIFAITTTLFCSDNGADSGVTGGGNVDALIKRTRGTNDPKAPVLCTLKVVIDPANGGTVSKSPDKEQYSENESVLINAAPEPGYRFTGWSGASTGTANPLTLQMDGNKELIANFLPENVSTYTLNVNANPIIGGTVTKSPDKPEYASGETVYITAAPEAGYTFTGWSGASASKDAAVTITMDGNKELIANFARQTYTLTVNANPANGGSISKSPGQSAYAYEEEVTVTAYPFDGYKFTGWAGARTGTTNPITVTMDGDKELTARFEWQGTEQPPDVPTTTYTLTVSPSPANGGTVSSNPYKTRYNANESVYVTAEANTGYRFVGWSGASSGTANPITVKMDANKELTAVFEILTYTLTVDRNLTAGGTVSRTPNQTNYNYGTTVTVTAAANAGYTFTDWSGASSSTSASVAVTMDGDKALTANFRQQAAATYTITFDANGGSGTVPSLSAQTGNSVTLQSGGELSRSGFTFGGWNTNSAGTGTNYGAGIFYTPTGDVTLYAKWTLNTYTITFDANGGTVTPTAGTTGEGWKLASLPTPTKTGYAFNGWYTATTGGSRITENTAFNTNTIIYAQWTLVYTITFNANGGTVTPETGTTDEGRKLASLPTPTKTGYVFDGWYTATTGGSLVTENTVFNTNTTIYARWTPFVSTVTTFVDDRDDRPYKKVTIGSQTWMAENLNYDDPERNSDVCYNNDTANCAKYGRLYNWLTAMDGATSSSNSPSGVRGICPAGWHLPSDDEWTALTNVGDSETAGTKLKSSTGWNSYSGDPAGSNEYGFSALPGGFGYSNGSFDAAGSTGIWWSATQKSDAIGAWYRYMYCVIENVAKEGGDKSNLFSVRCVEDD